MKIPPSLPDTDFARIAPLPTDEKRKQLERMKGGFSPWSYNPVRKAILDLYNVGGTLLPSSVNTPWSVIEGEIKRRTKGHPVGEPSNLEVARILHKEVRSRSIEAIHQSLGRFFISPGVGVSYWSDIVSIEDGRLYLPLCDFRRNNGFTATADRFAASIAHIQVIDLYPELQSARVKLISFPPLFRSAQKALIPRGFRSRILDFDTLYSSEQLHRMIAETTIMWSEINEERVDRARRTGSA